MPRSHFAIGLRIAVCALGLAPGCFAQTKYVLETSPANVSGVLSRHNLVLNQSLRIGTVGYYAVTSYSAIAPQKFISEVKADKDVIEFEADSEIGGSQPRASASIAPPLQSVYAALQDRTVVTYYGAKVRSIYVNQTPANLIELAPALKQFPPGNTIVAVIDTGVDPNQPALQGVLLNGYDFTRDLPGTASELADLSQSTVAILDQSTVAILDRKNTPVVLNQSTVAILDQSTVAILDTLGLPSDFGHGTMVSGLIHLVAPGARIMPLKAFRADGTSNLSDIIRAVYYAVDHGAKVINMSFSTSSPSPALAKAIAYANSKHVICVASAGNDGKRELVYPAALPGVIGVGSSTNSDQRSSFSNYDTRSAQTSAPGEAVITVYPGNNYAAVWGTSFSTALVSGAVALMLNVSPGLHGGDLDDAIDAGKQVDIGMGDARLDVWSSLKFVKNQN